LINDVCKLYFGLWLQEYCLQFTLKNKPHENQANTITAVLQGEDHVSGIRLTENDAAKNTIGSNFSHLQDTSPIWSNLLCGLTRFNHNRTANISSMTHYYNNSETYWDEQHRYTIGSVVDSSWLIKEIGQVFQRVRVHVLMMCTFVYVCACVYVLCVWLALSVLPLAVRLIPTTLSAGTLADNTLAHAADTCVYLLQKICRVTRTPAGGQIR